MHRREVEAEADRREEREADAGRDPPLALLVLLRREHDARDRAQTTPAICTGDGRSPVAMPKITGTIAEAPAIGATTLIAPIAMPR